MCKQWQDPPSTVFKVFISYQSMGKNRKGFDVTKATVVKALLEQYLKAFFGNQYQPSYLDSWVLFYGKQLSNEKTLAECGIEKKVEITCKMAEVPPKPQPPKQVNVGIIFEEDGSTAEYLDVDDKCTLSSLFDQYIVVVLLRS